MTPRLRLVRMPERPGALRRALESFAALVVVVGIAAVGAVVLARIVLWLAAEDDQVEERRP